MWIAPPPPFSGAVLELVLKVDPVMESVLGSMTVSAKSIAPPLPPPRAWLLFRLQALMVRFPWTKAIPPPPAGPPVELLPVIVQLERVRLSATAVSDPARMPPPPPTLVGWPPWMVRPDIATVMPPPPRGSMKKTMQKLAGS